MPEQLGKNVALLIDFENLVYGLRNEYPENYESKIDPEILVRVSEDYGQVVLANAYADWRAREVNQFQGQLYSLGIELIHVIGRRHGNTFKNAVDVKMAVDAVEMMWKYGHIDTFVIVSGDRDFIHVLKTLRRNGKKVIGISTGASASADFAELCDRFIRYDSLQATLNPSDGGRGQTESASLQRVKEVLISALANRPSGMKGAAVKPLLRRLISPTFDESEYGYSRLSDLLYQFTDAVRIMPGEGGGDLTIFPISTTGDPQEQTVPGTSADTSTNRYVRDAGLNDYRYTTNVEERHQVLRHLFDAMKKNGPFTFNEVMEDVQVKNSNYTTTFLAQYLSLLWQAKVFAIDAGQKEKPQRDRRMTLIDEISTAEQLFEKYEVSAIFKVLIAAGPRKQDIDTAVVQEILGLSGENGDATYAAHCLEKAKSFVKF